MNDIDFLPATEAENREIGFAAYAEHLMDLSSQKAEQQLAELLARHGKEFYVGVVRQIRRITALNLKERGEAMMRNGKHLLALAERQLAEIDSTGA